MIDTVFELEDDEAALLQEWCSGDGGRAGAARPLTFKIGLSTGASRGPQ